jgi:tetratricopeptide (TPR) repeat protein
MWGGGGVLDEGNSMSRMDTNPTGENLGPVGRSRQGANPVFVVLVALYALALGLSILLVVNGRTDLGVMGTLLVLTMGPASLVVTHALSDRRQRLLLDKIEELTRSVKTLTDQASLSNDARRVLNRQTEHDLLRQAIEEDIANRNWDAAMVLVKELAENFGYRSDAEEFRQKIEEARKLTVEREVADSIAYLDSLIINRRWDSALADAARIQRLYPDSPRVEGLKSRVEQARRSYKEDLEHRFQLAAAEGRADDAMALLKELDAYLTVTEAEPLREMARGVIGKARDRLGEQFKQAVQDKRWAEAVRIGERIIAEFPNTRMATEVRDVIDGIRIRASEMVPA